MQSEWSKSQLEKSISGNKKSVPNPNVQLKEYLESNVTLCVIQNFKITKYLLVQLNWLHEY